MCGVTLAVFSQYLCRPATKEELRKITSEQIAEIYKHNYWDVCRGDSLPVGIDYLLFDFAVNAGVGRAAKTLQATVGTTQDGSIGPVTLGVVSSFAPKSLIALFSESKRKFYKSLSNFPTFGTGWLNRVATVERNALAMLSAIKNEAT